MKVSVIIPIYRAEAFIERRATTLIEQTLRDVEYIFVVDVTPNNRIKILEDDIVRFPNRKDCCVLYIMQKTRDCLQYVTQDKYHLHT